VTFLIFTFAKMPRVLFKYSRQSLLYAMGISLDAGFIVQQEL
jgi:hypothetical protein